ncbi:MAG: Sua5/YciO/YrdC/YwlC family protein, partial [Acidimicrobiales bacterium]
MPLPLAPTGSQGPHRRTSTPKTDAGAGQDERGPQERRRIRVMGIVQGVGFRPFVYRRALALGLVGWVRNDRSGVLIDVEGPPRRLDRLERALADEPPRLANVTAVVVEAVGPPSGHERFRIAATDHAGPPTASVGIDTATCARCLAEVADPADRRYRYPFTNCTDCGPRYTIVRTVPYDRPATTMADFTMCAACQTEYDDPADRRFHAQPNACPACGPQLTWRSSEGTAVAVGDVALGHAVAALRDGRIVAVKGLGGYHLAVDATASDAVADLRRRKHRDDKPFAVMVPDETAAQAIADLDGAAMAALASIGRPVVLAPVRTSADLAPGVARGLVEVGVLLPYTPLHHLLLQGVGRPVVMTS